MTATEQTSVGYTKDDLQSKHGLTDKADVDQTLMACGLSAKKRRFSEDDEIAFARVRTMFSEGKVDNYDAAAKLFAEEHQGSAEEHLESTEPPLTIEAMLHHVRENVSEVTLTEALSIMKCCGLVDQTQYLVEDAHKFYEAVDLIKKQGKTPGEVAVHYGIQSTSQSSSAFGDVVAGIEYTAAHLMNRLAENTAGGAAEIFPALLTEHLATALQSDRVKHQVTALEVILSEALSGGNGGKSSDRMMAVLKDAQALPQSPPQNALPIASSSGS